MTFLLWSCVRMNLYSTFYLKLFGTFNFLRLVNFNMFLCQAYFSSLLHLSVCISTKPQVSSTWLVPETCRWVSWPTAPSGWRGARLPGMSLDTVSWSHLSAPGDNSCSTSRGRWEMIRMLVYTSHFCLSFFPLLPFIVLSLPFMLSSFITSIFSLTFFFQSLFITSFPPHLLSVNYVSILIIIRIIIYIIEFLGFKMWKEDWKCSEVLEPQIKKKCCNLYQYLWVKITVMITNMHVWIFNERGSQK